MHEQTLGAPKTNTIHCIISVSFSLFQIVLSCFSGTLYVTVLLLKKNIRGKKKQSFRVSSYSKSVSRGKNKRFTFTKCPCTSLQFEWREDRWGHLNRHPQTDTKTQVSWQKMNKDRLCCWFVLETAASRTCKEKRNCPWFVQAEVLTEMRIVKVCRINASPPFKNTACFLKYILIHLDPNSSCLVLKRVLLQFLKLTFTV